MNLWWKSGNIILRYRSWVRVGLISIVYLQSRFITELAEQYRITDSGRFGYNFQSGNIGNTLVHDKISNIWSFCPMRCVPTKRSSCLSDSLLGSGDCNNTHAVGHEGLGNEDKVPFPRALLPLPADSNRGPHDWESIVLSTEPQQFKRLIVTLWVSSHDNKFLNSNRDCNFEIWITERTHRGKDSNANCCSSFLWTAVAANHTRTHSQYF